MEKKFRILAAGDLHGSLDIARKLSAKGKKGKVDLVVLAGDILNQLVPLLTGLAVVWLLWNIVKYIEAGTGDPKARDTARDAIIFSIVLIFVMVSVWGLVGIVKGTVGIDSGTSPETVELPSVN